LPRLSGYACAQLVDASMMFCNAGMTSSVDAALGESQLQPEGFRRGFVAEDVSLGETRLGFGGFFADGFTRGAAIPGNLFDQGDHFLGPPCLTDSKSNDLEEMSARRQRF